jgi:hypothetical protein
MSPHALDSVAGSSLVSMPSDAITRPFWPVWISGLPEASVTAEPQMSSPRPSSTNRLAFLASTLNVGLATSVWGSWLGLASEVTSTRSPPTSRVTPASTLSVVTTATFFAGAAGAARPAASASASVATMVVRSGNESSRNEMMRIAMLRISD